MLRTLASLPALALAGWVLVLPASASAQEVECDTFPLNLAVHTDPIYASPHHTPALRLESDEIAIARGGRTTLYVSLVSQLGDEEQVEGFSLSCFVLGNVTIDSVTLGGTAAAYRPDGLTEHGALCGADVGFFGPPSEADYRHVTAACYFWARNPAWLPPTGTATLAAITISAPSAEDPPGKSSSATRATSRTCST